MADVDVEEISIHAPRTGSDRIAWNSKTVRSYFNPRSPHGERHIHLVVPKTIDEFQSTLPARGATFRVLDQPCERTISIHAPRTGSDQDVVQAAQNLRISIHAPRTGSDAASATRLFTANYFNPRSPHGERRSGRRSRVPDRTISIHAPRTGSDAWYIPERAATLNFNPRSPHGERRYRDATRTDERRFQSTLPARGATCTAPGHPRGGDISIHAPRTGSDPRRGRTRRRNGDFNPRSPHGERPHTVSRKLNAHTISIHAPRTGSDAPGRMEDPMIYKFQSTLPARGATHVVHIVKPCQKLFQSTLPARGATWEGLPSRLRARLFQSTLPARGATIVCPCEGTLIAYFNPRSPHGERPRLSATETPSNKFQSTLPARGATTILSEDHPKQAISIHAPRTGSDSQILFFDSPYLYISIHAPRTGSDAALHLDNCKL